MAKPNYNFQKRQRELARKKKKEDKRQSKLNKGEPQPGTDAGAAPGSDRPF